MLLYHSNYRYRSDSQNMKLKLPVFIVTDCKTNVHLLLQVTMIYVTINEKPQCTIKYYYIKT